MESFDLRVDDIDFRTRCKHLLVDKVPAYLIDSLERIQQFILQGNNEDGEDLLFKCEVAIDYAWEMLNTNLWVFVDDTWRLLYGFAMLYNCLLYTSRRG